jgi:hypothetical protein
VKLKNIFTETNGYLLFLFVFSLLTYLLTKDIYWSVFLALGFIWNLSMENEWVMNQIDIKKYKFSLIKILFKVHDFFLQPLLIFPNFDWLVKSFPVTIIAFCFLFLLQSDFPVIAVFLGALGYQVLKLEINFFKNLQIDEKV